MSFRQRLSAVLDAVFLFLALLGIVTAIGIAAAVGP